MIKFFETQRFMYYARKDMKKMGASTIKEFKNNKGAKVLIGYDNSDRKICSVGVTKDKFITKTYNSSLIFDLWGSTMRKIFGVSRDRKTNNVVEKFIQKSNNYRGKKIEIITQKETNKDFNLSRTLHNKVLTEYKKEYANGDVYQYLNDRCGIKVSKKFNGIPYETVYQKPLI